MARDGYTVSSTAGPRVQVAARDTQAVTHVLLTLRELSGRHLPLRVTSDDGILYGELVRVLDVTSAAGYRQVDVGTPED
jgi:biopolymer transport protein ExbD